MSARPHTNASPRSTRNRARIAQVTARLIAEHGFTDWAAARRKACRELDVSESGDLPANEEIEQALREYNTLFQPEAQAGTLRQQRLEALRWMERLEAWRPVLTGAVAAGWATEHSLLSIELEADDPKEVEMALINAGVSYGVGQGRGDHAPAQLRVESPVGELRLTVLTPSQRRNRVRRDEDVRLRLPQLRATL